jgi:hypothetical protein
LSGGIETELVRTKSKVLVVGTSACRMKIGTAGNGEGESTLAATSINTCTAFCGTNKL